MMRGGRQEEYHERNIRKKISETGSEEEDKGSTRRNRQERKGEDKTRIRGGRQPQYPMRKTRKKIRRRKKSSGPDEKGKEEN